MAGNQVTLTFAGDSAQLEKAFNRVQDQAKQVGDGFDKVGRKAQEATGRLEHVASATDEVDTLGSKATSSLGALSSGFELLGPKGEGAAKGLMTAALATDFLSGAGEAATIVTESFGKVVTRAKTAVAGMGAALKANAVGIGVWGAAIAATAVLIGGFIIKQRQASAALGDTAKQLDLSGGRFSAYNRQLIAAQLQEQGLIEKAGKLGISTQDLTDAVLGDAAAMDRVNKATDTSVQGLGRATSAQGTLAAAVHDFAAKVDAANTNQSQLNETQRSAATAADDARTALQEYNKAIQDQFDPMANLVHRLDDVKVAQRNYTDAVKDHGKNSPEAKQANLDLAEAILAANAAAGQASGTFAGVLPESMKATLRAGGFTEAQIKDIEKQFNAARVAGDKYAKNYNATANLSVVVHDAGYVSYRADERAPGRASGGSVMSGQTYLVGEQGPELVTFGANGYVHNASSTASMLAPGPSAGGGAMVLEIRSGGSQMDDLIVQIIQRSIKQGRLRVA